MRLRYLFLLGILLLGFCDAASNAVKETLDDVKDGADDLDIWVVTPDTGNQESAESEDDDRDLNTEDNNDEPDDEDVNYEDVNNEDVNDEDVNDEDVNDEDVNNEDVNDGDVNDEDVNDEDVNNEDVNDEDVNDEDVNDEDVNDEDVNNEDEDVNDEDVNDEDAEDLDKEHIKVTTTLPETLHTVTVTETNHTVNKHSDASSKKKGHVTSQNKKGNRPARVGESQRGKSASNKAGTKSAKIIANNQTNIDPNSKSSREGATRKKRLPPSSASPSIQLIIVVVGAVLACVLITGFIRWRVRKRLNNKKLGRMSENLAAYRSRMGLPKTSIMDTIYECECEDRLMAMRAKNTEEIHDADDPLEGAKTKEDELVCSHKFDQPPSIVSSRHYDNYLSSSKGEKEFDRARGSKKQSSGHKRHHHSHKSRYSRHHRRKSHHKTSQKTESISPTNEECAEENLDDINCSTSLLEQTDTTQVKRAVTDQEAVTSVPEGLTESNPHQHRRTNTGPVLTTWQSLSYNRDWVGRMWQEKHKVICISHVLRNTTAASNPDSEESPSESQTSDEDTQNQPTEAVPQVEHSMMATIQDHQNNRETVCRVDVDHSTDSTVITLFNSEEVPENAPEQCGLIDQAVAETPTCGTACDVAERTLEADISQTSRRASLPGFLSFSDYNREPPEYRSLLDNNSYSNHSMPLGNMEHHRHHRRHRRKRPEGRERSSRHLYSEVEGVDSSHTDIRDPPNPHSHEELIPLTGDYKSHEIPSNHRLEPQSGEAPTETTPMCTPISSEDPNLSPHSFTNSPNSLTVSSVASSFVPQEGIVLEQLSDGSQIIYLPPPLLPSYHNDTPPPYHK